MKVVHIESGLGNQMLSYAEYLVIKKLNPNDSCYIETIIYDLPECGEVICQWNGFELKRIFGIDVPNIQSVFSEVQWQEIIADVRKSEFWNKGWVYAPVIVEAFEKQGVCLNNYLGDAVQYNTKVSPIRRFLNTRFGNAIKRRILLPFYSQKLIKKIDSSDKIFIQTDENVFAGQTLGLRVKGVNVNFIEKEIRSEFQFPELSDTKNIELSNIVKSCNSVAIHTRRGDMLQSNGWCYKNGYFKRAVKYIRKKVEDPVFFFFCDSDSIEWCKSHPKIYGIDFNKDKVYFVDWNKGENSFRDMQLMAMCKHNIITNSSFGWWGAFLNDNPDKITCSPLSWLNTTNTF